MFSLGFIFWLGMIIWAVVAIMWGFAYDPAQRGRFIGYGLLMFILLFILGCKVFGWPVSGG
jgi:hypothetical protein